ncbi:MazG-like family protein [Streptomyces sp. NPDC008150]|uniref:MazG-like family protein n=1 Tax=Streptomyces sp. NPDC008150 TaxID=3364816 RepID=UPI0036E6696A
MNQTPEATPARTAISDRLWWAIPSGDDTEAKATAERMLDTYKAEVLQGRVHVPDPWQPVFRLVGWLDRQNGRSPQEIGLRLLKLVEEAGEVAQAFIGMVGQNPRKGVTHTRDEVCGELCDVIITAMVALVSIADGNPDDILAAKLAKVEQRAAQTEGGAA